MTLAGVAMASRLCKQLLHKEKGDSCNEIWKQRNDNYIK